MALTAAQRKRRLGRGVGARIARKTGKTASHVSRVLSGQRFSSEIVAEACQIARLSKRELFPEFADRFAGRAA